MAMTEQDTDRAVPGQTRGPCQSAGQKDDRQSTGPDSEQGAGQGAGQGETPSAGDDTAATRFLTGKNVPFETRHYDYAPQKGHIGEQAARAIGAKPSAVFKTLAVKIDRRTPAFAVIPVAKRVNFKALAAALGGKNAKMMQPDEAHERTGFVSGGTTPFGSRESLPTIIDRSAQKHKTIWINAGARGFLACMTPHDIQEVIQAGFADIAE